MANWARLRPLWTCYKYGGACTCAVVFADHCRVHYMNGGFNTYRSLVPFFVYTITGSVGYGVLWPIVVVRILQEGQ